jgi:hypothetical protein
MAVANNQLRAQVDLPTWEWTRFSPVVPTAGLSCSCVPDNPRFNETSGRYIYYLLNATNFWRYDTFADSYLQLASPIITPLTATSMRFAGAQGYYGRVISATSTTITTGMPGSGLGVGYRIRIISGRGAGQERLITSVSNPIVADFGGASSGAATSLTDTAKAWAFNNWVGYSVRIVGGTGINQVRKILYNTATVLVVSDTNLSAIDVWATPGSSTPGTAGWTAPAAGSIYQIEASTVTVDTAWDVQPDNTSRFVIQSGGIWMISGLASNFTVQYYSVLEDIWYAKPSLATQVPIAAATDLTLERFTENLAIWYNNDVSSGNTTTLTDTQSNWTTNQWAGYYAHIWTGAGRGQVARIANNTATTLTFASTLSTAVDSTSKYNIAGYDGGTLSSTAGRIVNDSSKTWTVNQWANYAIRIISGTGIGQTRQILSNGTTSITTYDVWNIQPDNTSTYLIVPNSQDLVITYGGSAETFIYRTGDLDMLSHGRILDEGVAMVAGAMLTDGTSTATHEIYEQRPVAITGLAGTSTITATTAQNHQFKVGQWVSVRGVSSAAADVYNVTGKVQIATIPASNQFTYTPFSAGTGSYTYTGGVALATTALIDASKYHADLATGGSTTTATFSRATPTNITGWYAYGTNIAAGAQVISGAGTTTVTFNLTGAGTPSGTITFHKWPLPVTASYSSGGGTGVFTGTMSASTPGYIQGWLAGGTNMGIGGIVTGGAGSAALSYSIQNSGTPSGTISFAHQVNNLPVSTGTYSSGSGTSITLSAPTAAHITGWYVLGTNIANGTTVTGGAGTATITLSTATSGTPSGTISFYPPSLAAPISMFNSAVPTVAATGMTHASAAGQLAISSSSTFGYVQTPISAYAAAPVAGVSKYVITRRDLIGQNYFGQGMSYLSGVAFGTQSVTTLVDTNSFWATATGSGTSGSTTLTLSAPGSPLHNGWYVSGTGIVSGSRIVSGAGTTTLTIDTPLTGTVSGTVTVTAWNQSLVGRRLRILTNTGANQELPITSVTAATGTLGFATATAAASGNSAYAILPTIAPGAGSTIQWISNSSVPARRGRYLVRARGGAAVGFDLIDWTNDTISPMYTVPITETLGAGSWYAYDQLDYIYFTKEATQRLYCFNVVSGMLHGAGVYPYTAGTAQIGNKMEIFQTCDGLKYLWINRHANLEHFRQLLF